MMKQLKFLLLIVIPLQLSAYTGEVKSSFNTPGNYPAGLCWDGQHLWITDFQQDKIFQLDQSGKVLKSIESPAYRPVGLAFDGKYLWCSDTKGLIPEGDEYHRGKIYKIDPENGQILHTMAAPSSSPAGITWDGQYLWCVDDLQHSLICFDPNDGTTIKEFKAPASNPQGITWDGHYLWVSDRGNDEIYMVDPENGNVILIAKAPGKYALDLAFDGKNLWNADFITKKVYSLAIRDGVQYLKSDESKQSISYRHLTSNFGPGNIKRMDVQIALPVDRPNQKIENKFSYTPNVAEIATDKWGQKTAHFVFENIPSGENREALVTYKTTTWNVRYFIYPEEVGSNKDIPQDIKDLYIQDNAKYEIHDPIITNAVHEAVGDVQNTYWRMRRIFNYIIAHLYYERVGGWNTAPTVLARGNGSCSEYSFVFISMCRAAGIPARYVGSIAKRGDDRTIDDVFHRWVEVYLPHYGWIPVDPSGGDQGSPRGQASRIGFVGNRFVITTQSGGGSETMNWNYNSNDYYISDPKTNVAVDYFGEWIQE